MNRIILASDPVLADSYAAAAVELTALLKAVHLQLERF